MKLKVNHVKFFMLGAFSLALLICLASFDSFALVGRSGDGTVSSTSSAPHLLACGGGSGGHGGWHGGYGDYGYGGHHGYGGYDGHHGYDDYYDDGGYDGHHGYGGYGNGYYGRSRRHRGS